jgi:hypothetical protein
MIEHIEIANNVCRFPHPKLQFANYKPESFGRMMDRKLGKRQFLPGAQRDRC